MKLENLKLTEDQKAAIRELVSLKDSVMTLDELESKVSGLSARISPEYSDWSYTDEDYGDGVDLMYADDQIECDTPYITSDGSKKYIDCQPLWEVFFSYDMSTTDWDDRIPEAVVTVNAVDIWIPEEFMLD